MAGNPDITILLTRPRAQSEQFARQLAREFGDRFRLAIAPLMQIRWIEAAFDLDGVRYLVFTSLNAVESFAQQAGRTDFACLCVGDRTAETARRLGFAAESAGGAAADLLDLVKRRMAGKSGVIVYLRGRRVACDLAAELGGAGFVIRESVVYEQAGIAMPEETRSLLASGAKVLVPLFSPESARRLMAETDGLKMPGVIAIAISENAARMLDPARFLAIRQAGHPTAEAILREIAAIL